MELTPAQIKQLRTILGYRTSPPTMGRYVRRNWPVFTYVVGVFGGFAALAEFLGYSVLAAAAAGALVATVIRDLKFVRRLVKGWALSSEITDWTRVEALLSEAEGSRPNGSAERP